MYLTGIFEFCLGIFEISFDSTKDELMVHLFALGFSDSSFSIPKESGITDLFRIALALWDFFIFPYLFSIYVKNVMGYIWSLLALGVMAIFTKLTYNSIGMGRIFIF